MIRQAIDEGKSIAETAKAAGVSGPTVYRYLKELQTDLAMEGLR